MRKIEMFLIFGKRTFLVGETNVDTMGSRNKQAGEGIK